jgi:hypothetical protein
MRGPTRATPRRAGGRARPSAVPPPGRAARRGRRVTSELERGRGRRPQVRAATEPPAPWPAAARRAARRRGAGGPGPARAGCRRPLRARASVPVWEVSEASAPRSRRQVDLGRPAGQDTCDRARPRHGRAGPGQRPVGQAEQGGRARRPGRRHVGLRPALRGGPRHRRAPGLRAQAALLYEETEESRERRERQAEERRLAWPAGPTGGPRPTKRDRRRFDRTSGGGRRGG